MKPTTAFSWLLACLLSLASLTAPAAERYLIDTKGAHAFITFRIQHLGFSWLEGRFTRFSGDFEYDEANPANNRVEIRIEMKSLDSDHAERDKHLRGDSYFDVKKYPTARFVSNAWLDHGDGTATLKGRLTLRGIDKDIEIAVTRMGSGKDPWGGYRRGFEGSTTLHLSDYRMKKAKLLGPAAEEIRIWLSLEGIRQSRKSRNPHKR